MAWTDKLQGLSVKIWVGIGLLLLNFVLLPFLFLSGDEQEQHEGDIPPIEILSSDGSLHEVVTETPHVNPEKMQNTHETSDDHGTLDTHASSNTHAPSSTHEQAIDHVAVTENISQTAHEPPVATDQHAPAQDGEAMTSSSEDLSGHLCYELGPLKTNDERDKLQNLVEIKGMYASIKYNRSHENLGYWVFIPALRSRALGRLKVEELKLKGFKDVVLLSRNEPVNAVSLGVYDDQKNAYKQLLRAQSLGFDAKLDIRYQSLGEMWLSVEVSKHKDLGNAGWTELTKDYPHVQIHSVNCR